MLARVDAPRDVITPQRRNRIDVQLHGLFGTKVPNLFRGIELCPRDEVERAWPLATGVAGSRLLEEGVQLQLIVIVRAQRLDILLRLREAKLEIGHEAFLCLCARRQAGQMYGLATNRHNGSSPGLHQ